MAQPIVSVISNLEYLKEQKQAIVLLFTYSESFKNHKSMSIVCACMWQQ